MSKLLVEKIVPKLKNGSQISGITSKGNQWFLWRVNDKYDIFGYDEEPPVEEGQEYDFDVKTEQKGKYMNTTISLKTARSQQQNDVMDALRKVYAKVEELGGKIDGLEELIMGLENTLKEKDDISKE